MIYQYLQGDVATGLPPEEQNMTRLHNPAHPGEVLRDYLPEGLGVTEAAKRLGVTRQALSALLNGRAGVSAEMSVVAPGYALDLLGLMW